MKKMLNRLFVIAALLTFTQTVLATIIIIDNEDYSGSTDNPLVTKSGDWTTSTAVSGYIGDNYESNETAANDVWMKFMISNHPDFVEGLWTIEMNWTNFLSNATNTTVFISRGYEDIDRMLVDQRQQDVSWYSLGDFTLNTSSFVTIDTRDDAFMLLEPIDGYVIADAFRFTSKSTSVSEPGALALLGLGLVGLGFRRRMAR